jgi:dihydroflavonol-4-reductase
VKRAFVTGGSGFVGANLIRLLLQEGYTVRALARSHSSLSNLQGLGVELVEGDLTDPDLASHMKECQFLFHVAAHYSLWRKDRETLYKSNVLGTRNVLAAARQAGIERTIYTSSVAAIGVKEGEIADETYQSPVEKLVGQYKKSKYWAEQEAVKAAQSGQDVVIVNPSTPIGPWDVKPTPTGDDIILRFLRRRMPAYMNTGLNLIHVQDVAWGHLLALEKGKSGDRYILGNENLMLKQILEMLSEITELPAPRRSIPVWLPLTVAWIDEIILAKFGKTPSVPLDGVLMARQKMFYTTAKAINTLGLPQTPIHKALEDAVDWFYQHGYASRK